MSLEIGTRKRTRAGFTLLEVMVALAVMGVATMIFVKLYGYSLDFATTARDQSVAASIAEEQLILIRTAPGNFTWEIPDQVSSEVFPIKSSAEEAPAGNRVGAISLLPLDPKSRNRALNQYEMYEWKAFGRMTVPTASYVEVTVVVYWERAGKSKSLALSSAVMRRDLPSQGGEQ